MNWKSARAVLAGALFTIVVTTLVDVVLHVVHVYPPVYQRIGHGLALLATSYRIVIGIAGAWLTARLAPSHPMRHAMVLGAIGMVFATLGVVSTWNMDLGPRWYPISLAVLALPQSWVGATLYQAKAGAREQRAATPGSPQKSGPAAQ